MIEINKGGSVYIYRINPYNEREIDRRKNVHRARWERYQVYTTPEAATRALYELAREDDE